MEKMLLYSLIINYLQVSCSTIKCITFSLKLTADLNILTPAYVLVVQHNWIYLTTFDMTSYNDTTGSFIMNLSKHSLIHYKWVEKIKSYTLFRKTTLKGKAFAVIQWNFPSEEVILRAEESNSQLTGTKKEVQNIQRTIEDQGRDS